MSRDLEHSFGILSFLLVTPVAEKTRLTGSWNSAVMIWSKSVLLSSSVLFQPLALMHLPALSLYPQVWANILHVAVAENCSAGYSVSQGCGLVIMYFTKTSQRRTQILAFETAKDLRYQLYQCPHFLEAGSCNLRSSNHSARCGDKKGTEASWLPAHCSFLFPKGPTKVGSFFSDLGPAVFLAVRCMCLYLFFSIAAPVRWFSRC